MDLLLQQRLAILLAAGEIDEPIQGAVVAFAKALEERFGLELAEDNAAMFITHLAMALARICRGEAVAGLDEAALEELAGIPAYHELPELYRGLERRLGIAIPEAEQNYITLHACVLVAKKMDGRK
ncbi:PRD domain-containing protein [Hydrogenispora ethanolica]|uniref:PRD domain-containing protein n=1 Tax=Hydrogenispora ethanolica TaxID=1082276 RepID=A0A4R1SAG1_HYDET|nr:PRD domain-containing protein [Hydrogenispora ethanolica]TCL76506.1 PRD domain-containing protein [Hydrogenispora ethanolica]